MDVNRKRQMNLSVLRNIDPNIIDIIDQSSHVVAYDFDQEKSSWKKRGIEGTLFVYSRNIAPFHGFIVLNRLGEILIRNLEGRLM